MSRLYQIHEFAELAGVTVKALRHYDRLGLLKPRRTSRGYRMYAERDLERLEQIIALKFLGVPLKQIKVVLDRPARALSETLRLQRRALEEKQELLYRAVRAIRMAEKAIERGKPSDVAILKRVIEVIDMDNDIEVMKKYYATEEAWEKHRRFYEEGPSREWQELYRDINAVLGEDPAAPKAQTLADRWLKLAVKAYNGDLEFQTHNGTAWMDREHWPASMKRRIAEFSLENVNEFMRQAVLSSRKKYFSKEAWSKLVEMRMNPARISATWQSRVDLFREVESFLGKDPANETVKAIAVRWGAYLDTASDGDPGVKAGLMNVWADRKNWTATVRWLEETVSMVTGERFDTAADFLDRVLSSPNAQVQQP